MVGLTLEAPALQTKVTVAVQEMLLAETTIMVAAAAVQARWVAPLFPVLVVTAVLASLLISRLHLA
jgi:hypothetical protein